MSISPDLFSSCPLFVGALSREFPHHLFALQAPGMGEQTLTIDPDQVLL